MTLTCFKCGYRIKTDEEVQYTGRSFFKEVASRVAYCITTPHEVIKDTIRHVICPIEEDR